MPSYIDAFIQIYSQTPPSFGAADICLADSPECANRAAGFAVVMLIACGEAKERLVRRVLILMPPEAAMPAISESSIMTAVIELAQDRFGRSLTQQELAAIRNRLTFAHAGDFSVESALAALAAAVASHDSAIILHAASYRAMQAMPELSSGSPTLQEDIWTPHLVHFARMATQAAEESKFYVLMDTGELVPHKEPNLEALRSITGCGLFSMPPEHDEAELIAAHSSEWLQQIREGRVGSAFASIDALPEWMDSQKSFLKLQLVDRVAPGHEVLNMLRAEVANRTLIDPSARVKMAQIAQRADDEDMASALLSPALMGLTKQEDLELALNVATRIADTDLMNQSAQRLATLFPNSSALFRHRLDDLLDNREYAAVIALLSAEHAPIDSGLVSFYRTIAGALQSEAPPAYDGIIREISRTTPTHENWARAVCSREALARREFGTSISLCLPSEGKHLTASTARMLLHATRRALLERTATGELVLSPDDLFAPVATLIQYLALNPGDGRVRERLSSLLSVETAGSLGLAVAASVALNAASESVYSPEQTEPEERRAVSDIDLSAFLRSAFEWMERESPVILGVTRFPMSLLPGSPDDVFDNLKQLIRFDQDLRDAATAKAFEYTLVTALLIAPLTTTPNEDLDLLRYAAARLIAANRVQRARDFAEQALISAGDEAERRRLAWLAFSDTYHRAQNRIDSLIGVACMFAVEDMDVDVPQIWQEVYLFIRILRDLYFFDAARSALARLRTLLSLTESPPHYERRLMTLDLGLQLYQFARYDDYDIVQLADLTEKIEGHCLDLMEVGEELSPAASLLVHCIHLAKLRGYPMSGSTLSTVEMLMPNVSAALADLITTVSSPDPEGHQLLALGKSMEAARSHQDIAFDLAHVGLTARRLLDVEVGLRNADAVILAIEALADHAIRGSSIGGVDSAFASLSITRERAVSISASSGCRVMFLALSETGRLARVSLADGAVEEVVVEAEEVFSAEALRAWSEQFPYGYSQTDDPNAFWTSTEKLGMTVAPSRPLILVMDTSLQRFPPNLMRLGEDFAGRVIPIGAVPSMSWLADTRKRPFAGAGRRKAWISTDATSGGDQTLVWLADRLQDCFDAFSFAVDHGATLPVNLGDSELVVLAAHGGILPEGRFIQRLTVNVDSAMYPQTLASSVAGSSVVVLFVCSGGRIDPHPQGTTTVGLVKQLLDQGCSTVVASPWPLDVKVPPRWLPKFMERWSDGDTVMEAVFQANGAVARWFGDPVDSLAMNVFGDPLRKLPDTKM